MRTRRVRGTALLVTAAALALATGCSGAGGAAGTSGAEKPDLTVAVVPSTDSAGFQQWSIVAVRPRDKGRVLPDWGYTPASF